MGSIVFHEGRAAMTVRALSIAAPRPRRAWTLYFLLAAGLAALGHYYYWWFGTDRAWFIVALPILPWTLTQLVGDWFLYLASGRPQCPLPAGDSRPTVDVFVTACREPYALIERSLRAACAMKGMHTTWLLDDGNDTALERLARSLGAGYLVRDDRRDAKAGNINAALARTDADIVAIFDADHAPTPDFLERTIGYFRDPQVGFVQVMLTFCNGGESWVASAGEESSRDFYNPTATGADRLGGATLVGSNALIRREALASCGGYRPGLAEDLATSVALHAAGWESVYVGEPLAPGFSPPDLGAWFTQQLKWARGVFEVLLTDYARLFRRLTWGQRLSYAVRMTHYWIGLVVGFHLVITAIVLLFPRAALVEDFESYLTHLVPLAVATLLIRQVALRVRRHPAVPATAFMGAMTLVYATWPVYAIAWMMSLLRWQLGFRLTPKAPTRTTSTGGWLAVQVSTVLLLGAGLVHFLFFARGLNHPLITCFAIVQGIPPVLLLWLTACRSSRRRYESGHTGHEALAQPSSI
jgi:cellulose synthase/poly-beta-1,6-N-acetylglucosamine synthase-like glycosyltransferase